MTEYELFIDCVDGETCYSVHVAGEHSKKTMREFLKKYDHEGSSISLVILEQDSTSQTGIKMLDTLHNQDAYDVVLNEDLSCPKSSVPTTNKPSNNSNVV